MALSTVTRRPRTLLGAILVATTAAGVLTPVVTNFGHHAHAASAAGISAQSSCDGVAGELITQETTKWYSTTVIKLTNHTDADKAFTMKVTIPGDATLSLNQEWRFPVATSGNEVTITGTLRAHEEMKDLTFGLKNATEPQVEHEHLHPLAITLNGAALGSCDMSVSEGLSTELSAKTWSKQDGGVHLYFADLSIPTGGDPSDRYEIFVDGKLATTAIYGSRKLSKNGDPVKQLKQILSLGTKAGVEHKVKVRPIGHHAGAFTNEITVTSGK